MSVLPSEFEHHANLLSDIEKRLRTLGADKALLKVLPKNANDKNQVYWSSVTGQ